MAALDVVSIVQQSHNSYAFWWNPEVLLFICLFAFYVSETLLARTEDLSSEIKISLYLQEVIVEGRKGMIMTQAWQLGRKTLRSKWRICSKKQELNPNVQQSSQFYLPQVTVWHFSQSQYLYFQTPNMGQANVSHIDNGTESLNHDWSIKFGGTTFRPLT